MAPRHASVSGFHTAVADHVGLAGEDEDLDAVRVVVPGPELAAHPAAERLAGAAGHSGR